MVEEPVEVVFVDLVADEKHEVGVPGFLGYKMPVTTTSLEAARKDSSTGFTALHQTVLNQFGAGHMVLLGVE